MAARNNGGEKQWQRETVAARQVFARLACVDYPSLDSFSALLFSFQILSFKWKWDLIQHCTPDPDAFQHAHFAKYLVLIFYSIFWILRPFMLFFTAKIGFFLHLLVPENQHPGYYKYVYYFFQELTKCFGKNCSTFFKEMGREIFLPSLSLTKFRIGHCPGAFKWGKNGGKKGKMRQRLTRFISFEAWLINMSV